MDALAYKANADAVIARLASLYTRQAEDRLFAVFSLPEPAALAAFRRAHAEGECEVPDPAERIAFWDRVLSERPRDIEDDLMPIAYLSEMDQGLYGGTLGGDVRFTCNPQTGWISSMVPRLLNDWSEFDRLRFSPSHPWFRRYLTQLRLFLHGAQGKFGVCPFVVINGVNFLFELVGATDAYLCLIERPDVARRAIELGLRVNEAVFDAFFEHVPLFRGGTFDFACQWMPGRTLMESVDPFHMTSVDYFEEWGRGPLEQMFARYDGGETHLHGNGRHLAEAVASVKGLKAIVLGDDKGFPPAFTILEEMRARCGNVPLTAGIPFPEFVARLERHQLVGGVLYHVSEAPDAAAVNRCMEKVRAYRR